MALQDSVFFNRIRSENEKLYGTAVDEYAPVLLGDIYSDKTHFVFELLQNAEDACTRSIIAGKKRQFSIEFKLFADRLELRHNGMPFDQEDIISICRIVRSTKKKDVQLLGKFGIGFKSVYGYTTSPIIQSGGRSFQIKNYVQPYPLNIRKDVDDRETLIVIPFDRDSVKDNPFSEIKGRLTNLGIRTLLFLNNIDDIKWNIFDQFGKYTRKIVKNDEHSKHVRLLSEVNGSITGQEDWLVFEEKALDSNTDTRTIQIAFLLDNNGKIIPATNTKLFVYFSTSIETNLKFLIQGPYETTPSRNEIKLNKWNTYLINRTALGVANCIPMLKNMGLLDVNCMVTLPTQYSYFSKEESIFKPIYVEVVNKFSGEEDLIPAYKGEFTNPSQALISRGEDLRELLSTKQLNELFRRDNGRWIDGNITLNRTPELLDYLIKVLNIIIITPDDFAKSLTEEFLNKQNIAWVKSFYAFSIGQEALWRESKSAYISEGILRTKPIILLIDGQFSRPYGYDGKPMAYLPSKFNKFFSNIVHEELLKDDKASEFIQKCLGLKEPDSIAGIIDIIIPKYSGSRIIPEKENIQDFTWIFNTLVNYPDDERKQELISRINHTSFIAAKNMVDNKIKYKTPVEVYISEDYTGSNDLEIYFENNSGIWFLDSRYLEITKDIRLLELIGCKSKILITHRPVFYNGAVIISKQYKCHQRGLDGFDPDCQIEGLENALQSINIEKSRIIWNLLKEYYRMISGTIESCSRQDYSDSTEEYRFSKMGSLLSESSWIPVNENFAKPSDVYLSALSEDFQEGAESQNIAKKLGFKTEFDKEILENFPLEIRDIIQDICVNKDVFSNHKSQILKFIKQLRESTVDTETVIPNQVKSSNVRKTSSVHKDNPLSGAWGDFEKSLSIPVDIEKSGHITWSSMNHEDEEKLRNTYSHELPGIVDSVIKTNITMVTSKVKLDGAYNPKDFLIEQYDGHCQICNTRLDIGKDKPLFNVLRLIELKDDYPWSDMDFNLLCLCPNHFALMKYGGRELTGISKTANLIIANKTCPEQVDERRGDYYIIKIQVAGCDEELFYTPAHMEKFVSFLTLSSEGTTNR